MPEVLIRPQEEERRQQQPPARQLSMRRVVWILVAAIAVGVIAGAVAFLVGGSEPEWTRGQQADIARLEGLAGYYANTEPEWTRGQRADIARLEGLAEYYQELLERSEE
jgi:hypothetical protein